MTNRLASATSPYLLQHAGNPVDWWEWGPEALAEAKRSDTPILLSVGYAACHWCHVMAHESFEDEATARFMNAHFVCIKVDREERPDVDAVYMRATQAMTGQGGWPMTCVLTPDGEPFFAGTYFPPEPRQGMPSFGQLLQALADAWRNKRGDLLHTGAQVVEHLRAHADAPAQALSAADLDAAVASLATNFDAEAGGFAGSPKFPPAMVLEFLLRAADRSGSTDALSMAHRTCEAMARGGIYDQLVGGFARYSVDRFWRVPHFEKMLYDNALLLRLYVHWWRQSGDPLARRIAVETGQFLLAELRTAEGGFASALDADTDGAEGTYYVWTPAQLVDVLGAEDGAWAAELLTVTASGNFEHGSSTLQLLADADDEQRWERIRAQLKQARSQRTYPHRDDKVVAAWNGLAITALTEAGIMLDEPAFVDAAVEAADLIADVHITDGRMVRTSRDGRPSTNAGVLEDYACTAEAFLAVLGATGNPKWLTRAQGLLDTVLARFVDPQGGFFDTADDAEQLVTRPKDVSDNASPSGCAALAHACITMTAVTGEQRYREAASSAIGSAAEVARQSPRFAGWTLAAAEAMEAGPFEIAVIGPASDRRELHRAAMRSTSPGAVVIAAEVDADIPLAQDRPLLDGRPTAYVCRDFVCQRPVTTPTELAELV